MKFTINEGIYNSQEAHFAPDKVNRNTPKQSSWGGEKLLNKIG